MANAMGWRPSSQVVRRAACVVRRWCTYPSQKPQGQSIQYLVISICYPEGKEIYSCIFHEPLPGADPGILVRGGAWIFFKGIGFGGHLKAPNGFRAMPWWGPRGRSPRKLLNFSDFRSKI